MATEMLAQRLQISFIQVRCKQAILTYHQRCNMPLAGNHVEIVQHSVQAFSFRISQQVEVFDPAGGWEGPADWADQLLRRAS
jgi:hypothetical protein